MGKINCCNGCVAPKRHLGCHAECEEYINERKLLDEAIAKDRLENPPGRARRYAKQWNHTAHVLKQKKQK